MSAQPFQQEVERAYCRALVVALGDDGAATTARRRLDSIGPISSPAMAALVERFGMTSTQTDFVWAVIAHAVEPRMMAHAEAIDGPPARRGLSAALHARLAGLDEAEGRRLAVWLAGDNPLLDAGLLVAGDVSYVASATPIAPARRLIGHLSGDSRPDPSVTRLVALDPAPLHDEAQIGQLGELKRIVAGRDPALVIVEGARGSGRRTALACACPRPALAIRARFETTGEQDAGLRALRREIALDDVIPVLADFAHGGDPAAVGPLRSRLEAWIRSVDGLVVITTSEWNVDLELDRPLFRIRWPTAEVAVRRELWTRMATRLDATIEGELDALAMQYRIGPGGMERALRSSAAGRASPLTLRAGEVVDGIRHNIAERLGSLARRVEVRQRWEDLVLGEDTTDQVDALVARIRHAYLVLESWQYRRKMALGQGVAALFSGPPGTGKTMVAGLIAAELGLDLYQVDLSQIVSKWVGETEKQLARVFEAAEEGHALLLFDEADALFGQRSTELKGATDRYANLEVNYLLQRIESFGGLTILTTNLDASIDKAVKRRLAAHIVFAAPEEDERERLWQRLTDTGAAPLDSDLDYAELATTFPTMTGANIRNAAIAAAFLAASDGAQSIAQVHLMRAARAEYRSMGHVLADRSLSLHRARP